MTSPGKRRPLARRLARALAVMAFGLLPACQGESPPRFDQPLTLGGVSIPAARLNRGAAAYTQYCRACHGDAGDGGGTAALGLRPPPRDLRLGVYKFAAVPAGQLPNDADFRRIIRHGLHGTAMLAWDLPDGTVDDIVAYIKTFSPRWRAETPGQPVQLSADPWSTGASARGEDAAIQRGKRVYHGLAMCAVACHPAYVTRAEIFAFTEELTKMRVEEFRPDLYAPVAKASDYGVAIVPPDFTFNVLRAGETVPDIARAIAAGVGGTAMPTWKGVLPDDDLWAMAHYVAFLIGLRGSPAADTLHARLLAQPPWVAPPPAGGAR